MKDLHEFEAALLDYDDGTCRDVNFEGATWEGVAEFLRSLEQFFKERSAFDGNGNSLNEPHWETAKLSARRGPYANLHYWGGNAKVTELQCFICCEDDDTPFVELTFFPEQVLRTEDLGRDFMLNFGRWVLWKSRALSSCVNCALR